MNLQAILIYPLLFAIGIITIGCQPESQRDSVRKSDLVGTKWKLTKLTHNREGLPREGLPIEDAPDFSLEFRDQLVGGRSGCNNDYQVGWRLGPDGRFALSGPVAITTLGCLEAVRRLENSYITVLEGAHTIVIDGTTLVIASAVGELVFTDDK